MNTAFVIYEGMTSLDLFGAYDPLTRLRTMDFLPDFDWDICSFTDEVRDGTGLQIKPAEVQPFLGDYDLVYVPGARDIDPPAGFVDWIRTAESAELKVSVCTGALLLGEAGFLSDHSATTHPMAFTELEQYCDNVVRDRIVDEGPVVTARGVTASIDLGLHLCERVAGTDVKEAIRKQMDYPYNRD